MNKVYIGGDESYDKSGDGNFILAFIVFPNSDCLEELANHIEKLLWQIDRKEIKNKYLNDKQKNKIFEKLIKHKCEIYYFNSKLLKNKIPDLYIQGVKHFAEFYGDKTNLDKIDVKLDSIGGREFQGKCKKTFIQNWRSSNTKIKFEFIKSESSIATQVADICAGEIRLAFKSGNKNKFYRKSKSLI